MGLVFTGTKTFGEPTDLSEIVKQEGHSEQTVTDWEFLRQIIVRIPSHKFEIPVNIHEGKILQFIGFKNLGIPYSEGNLAVVDMEECNVSQSITHYSMIGRDDFIGGMRKSILAHLGFSEQEAKYSNLTRLIKSCLSFVYDPKSEMVKELDKISREHLFIYEQDDAYYVGDNWSLIGTWVDGKKIGMQREDWPHWELWKNLSADNSSGRISGYVTKIKSKEPLLLRMNGGKTIEVKPDESLICNKDYEQAEEGLSRLMNEGVVPLKDGSEIVLGKNKFGDAYRFVFKQDT